MSTTFNTFIRGLGHAFDIRQIGHGALRAVNIIAIAWRVRRERNQLAGLDARTLSDIGVYPRDAEIEARRGLTDIPPCRLPRD